MRTFAVNAALARAHGWRTTLRIEDLDTPRVKAGVIDETLDTLRWLGLTWDDQAPLQSADLHPYREAMRALAGLGLVYPCERTRSDIERAASAPNEGDAEARFGPELRPTQYSRGESRGFDREDVNWRFAVEPGMPVEFEDRFVGPQAHDVAATVGDFLVWTKRRQPSYQLAVVVDDARQQISQIVRGDDLLPSAARQSILWRAVGTQLGFGPFPEQWHLPLVRGTDGRRLAKRHGDTRIAHYRSLGVPAARVIGLVAWWSGVGSDSGPEPMSMAAFAGAFDAGRMRRADSVFTEADDRWLTTP